MTTNERNWLIRTSQNQILGPVQKTKIIEFIQKGALGLNDEVTSGNGYWFLLREKDLVEKYIYGDIPQSYNPISEAKSTLKNKHNPNKTTSINVSPSNNVTQIINLKDIKLEDVVVPKNEDLEFPDVELIKATVSNEDIRDIKIPANDDLEFPDVTIVAQNINLENSLSGQSMSTSSDVTVVFKKDVHEVSLKETKNTDEIILPKDEDLEFPDMDFISNVQNKLDDEIEVTFEVPSLTTSDTKVESSSPNFNLSNPNFGIPLELESKKVEDKNELNKKERPFQKFEKKNNISVYNRNERNVEKEVDDERPVPKLNRNISPELKNRNDTYLFIILVMLVAIIAAIVFYYYRFILNRPLPV